jgi:hypothetical protein
MIEDVSREKAVELFGKNFERLLLCAELAAMT